MPWRQTSPMDQRTPIHRRLSARHALSITELCALYGVSRKTGYKWIDRYCGTARPDWRTARARPAALRTHLGEQIVAALHSKRASDIPAGVPRSCLLSCMQRHPRCGCYPARSTCCDILRPPWHGAQEALAAAHRPSRQAHQPDPRTQRCLERRLQRPVQDRRRQYCYPLTVTDGYSRYLLGCQALSSTAWPKPSPCSPACSRSSACPSASAPTTGCPLPPTPWRGCLSLSAWWVRLGVLPELIEPGKPQQNGRHERMHRTLKAETPPARPADTCALSSASSIASANEFNSERPHEALDMQTPARDL